jgi:hypothetical protein
LGDAAAHCRGRIAEQLLEHRNANADERISAACEHCVTSASSSGQIDPYRHRGVFHAAQSDRCDVWCSCWHANKCSAVLAASGVASPVGNDRAAKGRNANRKRPRDGNVGGLFGSPRGP